MGITHVVVSDLHLGAQNSLLTNVGEDGLAHPGTTSPVLAALIEALKSLLGEQQDPPVLVMAGDVFELALTTTSIACDTFSDFVGALFDTRRPLVAPEIVFVAGNHDHHLWELARQHQYVDYIQSTPSGQSLREDWHVTHLFPGNDKLPHDDPFITSLARRATGNASITVRHCYPNYGIAVPNRDSAIVVHHGHYTESMYRLMELLHKVITPSHPDANSVWHIETDNYAWVDFFWSTMGRSGDAGADINAVYEMLQSEKAKQDIVDRLVAAIVERRQRTWKTRFESFLLRKSAHIVMSRRARLERHRPDQDLSVDAERGLQRYLDVAVAEQLREELGALPTDLTFIFGHTHKPFARTVTVDGIPNEVQVLNTGGWVVDTTTTAPLQGSNVVLIDDRGRVAAIEIYRQGCTDPVSVVALGSACDELVAELRTSISSNSTLWSVLSSTIATNVTARHEQLRQRIAIDTSAVKHYQRSAPGAGRASD